MRGKDQKRAERARSPRRALTPAELKLWTHVRDRRLGGFKFARQETIDRYYVDFVCRERRLIIELDGGQHAESPEDRRRDRALRALGYRVIRLWNNDVIEKSGRGSPNSPGQTRKIAPHPGPLPASGAREIIAIACERDRARARRCRGQSRVSNPG